MERREEKAQRNSGRAVGHPFRKNEYHPYARIKDKITEGA